MKKVKTLYFEALRFDRTDFYILKSLFVCSKFFSFPSSRPSRQEIVHLFPRFPSTAFPSAPEGMIFRVFSYWHYSWLLLITKTKNMKKILLLLFLLSTTVLFAQNATIRLSFQREYPNVNYDNVRWEQRGNQWHGIYKDDYNRDVDAYYDDDGRRIDTHIRWDRKQVPTRVETRITRRYHTDDYDAYRIERPAAKPLFQIRIGTRQPVYMDERGRKKRYDDNH